MNDKLTKLKFALKLNLSYNHENKERFKRDGLSAMRLLAKEMGFVEHEVDFNPGGIAVSGDLMLKGMFPNGKGVALYISQGSFRSKAGYCRAIASLKDYTGGPNRWIELEALNFTALKKELEAASNDVIR